MSLSNAPWRSLGGPSASVTGLQCEFPVSTAAGPPFQGAAPNQSNVPAMRMMLLTLVIFFGALAAIDYAYNEGGYVRTAWKSLTD